MGLLVVGKFGNNFKAIPDGINQLELDWNKEYHVGYAGGSGVLWGDMVPAYQEVVHYSPNWVTWANKERGLVGVVKHVDV